MTDGQLNIWDEALNADAAWVVLVTHRDDGDCVVGPFPTRDAAREAWHAICLRRPQEGIASYRQLMAPEDFDDPPEVRFEVHTHELLDTGIGQEAGYEDDKAFAAAIEADYAAMSKEQREIHDRINAKMYRAFLYGDEGR